MLQRIGRYEILDRVASGGQGTVYRARDTVLDRVVAVKVINQPVADDPAYLEALQREARLAARLSHPNIATVYDFQVEGDIAYIVMEFVPDALDRQLRGSERLPWRRAVEIGLQTSRALQHAHDQGVVHRDIKPQNILLRETGAAAVSDFGIARALASSTRSQTGGVMGTPAYMAPEQWAGGAVDGRLDQYGLGIVLYEIITGSPPFQGDSMEALYVQHREAPVPPIASSLQIPDEVESVIRKTLEKSADDRYGSAAELADALEGALTGGAAQGPRTEVSPPPSREPARPAPAAAAPPPRQPAASGAGSGRSGGMPSWLLFGGLGAVVIAVIAIVIAVGAGGGGDIRETVAVEVTREVPVTNVVQKVVTQEVPVTRTKPVTDVFAIQRERMVVEDIEARGIFDPLVLAAMRAVPRHMFVPERYRNRAYDDTPVPIEEGSTISQPYVVALMSQLSDLEPGDKVLEVGTGSGYQAAVLAQMGMEVYSVEIIPALADHTRLVLDNSGYSQVKTLAADGYYGWEEHAPFDAIIVTAAPDHIPPPLLGQLKSSGNLVIPVGPPGDTQTLWLTQWRDGKWVSFDQGSVRFGTLLGR